MAIFVDSIRASRRGTTIDGGAAGCVGDDHAIAEQLRNQLDIRCLAAACACARELEQRLQILATDDGGFIDGNFRAGQLNGEIPVCLFRLAAFCQRLHFERFLLSRADLYAVAAACAIQRGELHAEFVPSDVFAAGIFGDICLGSASQVLLFCQERTDARMRADQRALVAHDAVFRNPLRNIDGNASLLELGRARGDKTSRIEGGDGQRIALLRCDGVNDFLEVFVFRNFRRLSACGCLCPGSGVVDLLNLGDGHIDGLPVHVDDIIALLAIGLLDGRLHVFNGIRLGNDTGNLEESCLQAHVDSAAQADFSCDFHAVDVVELQLLGSDLSLHGSRELVFHIFGRPGAVQKERAALFDALQNVIARDVAGVMACDEICDVDEIGRLNGRFAKA